MAGLVGGADGDTFQPGAAHGGGVREGGGRSGDQQGWNEEASEHGRTLGRADLGWVTGAVRLPPRSSLTTEITPQTSRPKIAAST